MVGDQAADKPAWNGWRSFCSCWSFLLEGIPSQMVSLSVFTGSLCTVQEKKKVKWAREHYHCYFIHKSCQVGRDTRIEPKYWPHTAPPKPYGWGHCPSAPWAPALGLRPPPSRAEPFLHPQIHFLKAALQLLSSPSLYVYPGTPHPKYRIWHCSFYTCAFGDCAAL